jgi:Tol biopolymer transport system component
MRFRAFDIAVTAFTVALAAGTALVATGLGGPPTPAAHEGQAPLRSSPTLVSSVAALPGVLAYVSDSDYYGSDGRETLATVRPDGTHNRVLEAPASVGYGLLAFSPTGERLAYFRASPSTAKVDVMDLASRKVATPLTLRGRTSYVDGLAWSSNGRDLIVGLNERPGSTAVHSGSALWSVPVDGGRPKRLTPFDDAGVPTVMPDGDIAFVVSKTFSSSSLKGSAVWVIGPDGSRPVRILTSPHFVDTLAVSPDGRTLAYTVVLSATTTHLESVTVAGRHRATLTPAVKNRTDISPSWSPNGGDIAFLSSRAGRHAGTRSHQLLDAYVMAATGKGPKETIARNGDKWSVLVVAWGP